MGRSSYSEQTPKWQSLFESCRRIQIPYCGFSTELPIFDGAKWEWNNCRELYLEDKGLEQWTGKFAQFKKEDSLNLLTNNNDLIVGFRGKRYKFKYLKADGTFELSEDW
jgi:hypothetical protein